MHFRIPPCIRCGACCAHADPAWVEVFESEKARIPGALLTLHAMKMTPEHQCIALEGHIGGECRCTIYPQRPLACRQIEPGSTLCLYMLGYHRVECVKF